MITAYALVALAPVFGLAAYCISHVVLSRTNRSRGNYYPLVLGCQCGLAVTAAISLAALLGMHCGLADGLALAGLNLTTYLALAFGYFNFVNLNITSLRIRMIQELADSGGRLPADALAGLYNTETIIALRIDRLTRGGHLAQRGGRYYSGKRRFLLVARIFDLLRWAILGQRSLPSPSGRGAGGEGSASGCENSTYPLHSGPHPIPLPVEEGTEFIQIPVPQVTP
jgi:hypothetical protein